MYEWNKPPSYYSLGYKIDNFLQTRLRVGMSSLNAHLFSINSPQVDSPHCKCELIPETVKHYFFFCPRYILQRDELQRSLINLVANYAKLTLSDKLDIILHGLNLNKTVCLAVAASIQK